MLNAEIGQPPQARRLLVLEGLRDNYGYHFFAASKKLVCSCSTQPSAIMILRGNFHAKSRSTLSIATVVNGAGYNENFATEFASAISSGEFLPNLRVIFPYEASLMAKILNFQWPAYGDAQGLSASGIEVAPNTIGTVGSQQHE